MDKIKFGELYRFRQEPNVYDGKNLDQHKPRWIIGMPKEGDESIGNEIVLKADTFPMGTEVIVKEPLCPKCEEIYENCLVRGNVYSCEFDWENCAEELYS